MKDHDLEVTIPQQKYVVGQELTKREGTDPAERQSTQLVDPNDRDSIIDETLEQSGKGDSLIHVAALPTDPSLADKIHPIIESREQELSKYTLKPTTNSSNASSNFRGGKALPSIRNLAAEVEEKHKEIELQAIHLSTAPKSKFFRVARHPLTTRAAESKQERNSLSLQHRSVYTKDPNRTKYLFTNLRRLAMINDPISRLSERQKQ